jgi:hypothetical protein
MPDIVGFSPRNAARIVKTVLRDERRYNNGDPPRARYPDGPGNPGLRPAGAIGTINAGSLPTPSAGQASLYGGFDGTSANGAITVEVFNPYRQAFAAGTTLWLTWFGGWWIVAAEC